MLKTGVQGDLLRGRLISNSIPLGNFFFSVQPGAQSTACAAGSPPRSTGESPPRYSGIAIRLRRCSGYPTRADRVIDYSTGVSRLENLCWSIYQPARLFQDD